MCPGRFSSSFKCQSASGPVGGVRVGLGCPWAYGRTHWGKGRSAAGGAFPVQRPPPNTSSKSPWSPLALFACFPLCPHPTPCRLSRVRPFPCRSAARFRLVAPTHAPSALVCCRLCRPVPCLPIEPKWTAIFPLVVVQWSWRECCCSCCCCSCCCSNCCCCSRWRKIDCSGFSHCAPCCA